MSDNFLEAAATWKDGLEFKATGRLGASLMMGSENNEFSPMELVLIGLGGCTGMDVIDILRKKRQQVTAFEVRVHGDRAAEYPLKYTHIEVTYVVTGRQIDPEAVRRAIELSETKYCSVAASLNAKIANKFEIVETV